jgi:hypothetical protein
MAKVTSYIKTFEDKLDRSKKKIKQKIETASKNGSKVDRDWLKHELKSTKTLRKMIKEIKRDLATSVKCPQCSHTFKID